MPQNLRDRIWVTAQCRMEAERRLRLLSRIFSVLTVWYSTVLTCLTVYQLIAEKNSVRDVSSAALAVALLALSVFIPSLNLEQQADRFRECYLKLQRLLDGGLAGGVLSNAYYDILDGYPNHLPKDYNDFVVSAKLKNKKITSSGESTEATWVMCISFFWRRILGSIIVAFCFALPAFLYKII